MTERRVFPKRKTIPAELVGMTLTISDETLREIEVMEDKRIADVQRFLKEGWVWK